ncbi:BrnT family toxin [Treponema socranskii]|uniref:BrnT family toxin n=1 Tax=Treponema socranskii TaxID=53419 RepID=UPI003D8D1EE6
MTVTKGRFEWDSEKDRINKEKHGLTFEEASEIFKDPNSIEFYDNKNSMIDEDRYIVLGDIESAIICVVVYVDRREKIRIVSARPAVSKEEIKYYGNIKKTLGRN